MRTTVLQKKKGDIKRKPKPIQEPRIDNQTRVSIEPLSNNTLNLGNIFDALNQNIRPEFQREASNEQMNQLLLRLLTQKQTERINYLSSKDHPNFHEYMRLKNGNTEIPTNCIHINIAYMAYFRQENSKEDPTEVGRKIKRAHLVVN